MLSHLTPAVHVALANAEACARHQGAAEVEPIHLLEGLLKEEEGRAASAFKEAGLDPAALAGFFPGPAAEPTLVPDDIPLPRSRATELVLRGATALARELSGERTTASEQVLLAVLEADEALRAALEARGLDWQRLQAAVRGTEAGPLPLDEPLHLAEPDEQLTAARILDAAANRAREAVRVVEDYCRFVLDDALLTRELKELRHGLTEALAAVPGLALLQARATPEDVGTALTTPQEERRESAAAVARANLKRLQEALRSLEEFGKLFGPELGAALEKVRYRTYTLEKAIVLGTAARQRLADARLYVLVTADQCRAGLEWTIEEAAAGGAHVIQLREKNLSDRDLLERARKARRMTRRAGVLFIMNDRADLARLAEADGVHLGQDDLSVREARRILGPDALIGVSTHDLDQVRRAVWDGASYIGVGPTFPSATKSFAGLAGLDFVRRAAAETSLPAFVIGGVTAENLPAALEAGARRVAVAHAICQADDPRAAAARLRRLLDQASPQ